MAKQSELLPDGLYSIKVYDNVLFRPCYFGETVNGHLFFVSENMEKARRRGRFRLQRNADGSVSLYSAKQSKYLQLDDGALAFSAPSSDFHGAKFELDHLVNWGGSKASASLRSLETDEFVGLTKLVNLKIQMKSETESKARFEFATPISNE